VGALLSSVFEIFRQTLIEKDHRLAIHHSILGPAKREYVNACVPGYRPEFYFQTCCRIRDARPIHVQEHLVVMRKL
jgi:hypothetical protein